MAGSTALSRRDSQELMPFGITQQEYQVLADTIAKGADPAEFKVHLMLCNRMGLSPVGGQVFFVKRWDGKLRREIGTTQVGIAGFRSIAEDSGEYEGPAGLPKYRYEANGPWTEEEDAERPPYAAKVGVFRKGWRKPVERVALWKRYVQTTKEGHVTAMWAKFPHLMLSKCAEALALRQAFPQKLHGLYTPEEMGQAENVDRPAVARIIDVSEVDEEPEPEAPPLTPEEKVRVSHLHNTLPDGSRWGKSKLQAEMGARGYEGTVMELVKAHVSACGAGCEHLKNNAAAVHDESGQQGTALSDEPLEAPDEDYLPGVEEG